MSRVIKFRVWNTKRKRWANHVELLELAPIDVSVNPPSILTVKDGDGEWIYQQFTGLFDKNGKEIYEGDIVRELPGPTEPREFYRVEWRDFRWTLVFRNPFDAWVNERHFKDAFQMKVIGNIYDNPDLLQAT